MMKKALWVGVIGVLAVWSAERSFAGVKPDAMILGFKPDRLSVLVKDSTRSPNVDRFMEGIRAGSHIELASERGDFRLNCTHGEWASACQFIFVASDEVKIEGNRMSFRSGSENTAQLRHLAPVEVTFTNSRGDFLRISIGEEMLQAEAVKR